LCSGTAALAILLLPLVLVLLMMLFETTAHGVFVLFGMVFNWLRTTMPGSGNALPPFRTVEFHPLDVIVGSAARSLPCLCGLVLILLHRQAGPWWWWIVMLWGLTAWLGGTVIAFVLIPGILVSLALAWPVRATMQH